MQCGYRTKARYLLPRICTTHHGGWVPGKPSLAGATILSEMRSRTDRLQRALTAFVRQPVDFCGMLASRLRNLHQRPVEPYLCDPRWEAELHTQLGQPQPCAAVQAFWPLWEQVLAEMTSRGVLVIARPRLLL
jgi:hypothetical protein